MNRCVFDVVLLFDLATIVFVDVVVVILYHSISISNEYALCIGSKHTT